MTRKTMKIAMIAVAALVISLTAGVVLASTKGKAELPEYVGSTSCLGCHAEKFTSFESSLHATGMVRYQTIADLPAPIDGLSPELLAELEATDFIFHGYRFFSQDPKTGELKYTGIEFDRTKGVYIASTRKGNSFDTSCGFCHAGTRDAQTGIRPEAGIGCEQCHGPGRDHVLGKGDPSKISNSTLPSQNCAGCHSGNNQKAGGIRFPAGYRPGKDLTDLGFQAIKVDPAAAPAAMHHKGAVPQWEASGHANATNLLIARGETYLNRQECIYCHSTSAGLQIADGVKFEASKHLVNDGVSCVACHDPHGSTIPGQLKKDAQALCLDCHTVGRTNRAPVKIGTTRAPHSPQGDMVAGTGALGIADTKGAHTDVTCIECHMSDGNHQFKVLEPNHVTGTTRKDACSACHTDSSAESRAVYLELWSTSITSRLETIAKDVAVIDERLKANPNALTAEQTASYKNWRANFWYVQKDKSGGAHNFEYAIKILSQTAKEIAKLRSEMK